MANKLYANLTGVWVDKAAYDKNECEYHEVLAKGFQFKQSPSGLAEEVAKARQFIKQSLQCMDGIAAIAGLPTDNYQEQLDNLIAQNKNLQKRVEELSHVADDNLAKRVKELEAKVKKLETTCQTCPAPAPANVCSKPAPKKEAPKKEEAKKDEDDDIDLFGSDSEDDAEKERINAERLQAYAAKKSKKPAVIAKSSVILDVKPWDDETDMAALEAEVRKIEADGLLWGASKLVPVAYNIKKLQINCVVEDDKISIDWLSDKIQEIEDYVQSVDIAAFNKI